MRVIMKNLTEFFSIETGIPFDWETLGGGGKREKKVTTTTEKSPTVTPEERNKEGSKNVGWKYRYRVSKMKEAQKYEAAESSKTTKQKQDQLPPHERLDPVLAKLTPEQRSVGWQYRFVEFSREIVTSSSFCF